MRLERERKLALAAVLACSACQDGSGGRDSEHDGGRVQQHDDAGSTDGGIDAGDAADQAASADSAAHDDAGSEGDVADLPYARHVVSFVPGLHAGFGAAHYPDVVLGPPKGGGTGSGSFDVLSLGAGGVIVLDFGDKFIVDGDGPDFVVFENVFWINGDPRDPFTEPGYVSVSEDGRHWHDFPCDLTVTSGDDIYPGCAGVHPTLNYDPFEVLPLDVKLTGGDPFDLADLGLSSARYVRIRDASTSGAQGNSAGFDLDAVGIVHVGLSAQVDAGNGTDAGDFDAGD